MKMRNEYRIAVITVVTVVYFFLAHRYLPDYWSSSILNFPFGMFVGYIFDKLYRPNLLSLLLSVVFVTIAFHVGRTYIISLCATFFAVNLMCYLEINNKVLYYIGHDSINFYIFQLVAILFCTYFFSSPILYTSFVLIITVLLSVAYTKYIDKKPIFIQ